MKTGILYIVATPIGNLGDITLRAIETLKKADLIACEDTRVTAKLLNHYSIKKPLISYHQHSKITKIDRILKELKEGKNIALVTDAGTPGISDPGNKIIEHITQNIEHNDIVVLPMPGVSALSTIISLAGINLQKFVFLGFPPHKKGRDTFLRELAGFKIPVIYFESPHRLIKNLELLKSMAPEKKIILGRELTKMFEEIVRGNVDKVLKYFQENNDKVKGEFVIIVY